MSKIIKPLEWAHRKSDNIVHATPKGMRYAYYIKLSEKNSCSFELAYVENNGNFQEYGVVFDSLESAQKIATKHYHEQVCENILPEFL